MIEGMDLQNLIDLLPMLGLGMLLGALYLLGLWFTVEGVCRGRFSATVLLLSLLLRMSGLLAAFYLIVGDGQWQRLLAALAGFVLVRILASRSLQNRLPASRNQPGTGA